MIIPSPRLVVTPLYFFLITKQRIAQISPYSKEIFPYSGSLPLHPPSDPLIIPASRIARYLTHSRPALLQKSVCLLPPSPPPPAPPSPTPPSHHPQPTCSRPLILVLEQVLLPLPLVAKNMRSSVLLALVSHILTTHPLPARGGQYVGLGAAGQRADEPGMSWVEGVHQTNAVREYVQPLVSSYSGQASATDPTLSGCHHAPQKLFAAPVTGSTCHHRNLK